MALSRRRFSAGLAATLAAPFVGRARAQSRDAIRSAIASLNQLHTIQVQVGNRIVVEEARSGRRLDRVAHIKSGSKSLVALLLGTAIGRGEIAGIDATLGSVAPGLVPSDATEGAGGLTMEHLVTLRAGLEPTSGPDYGAWIASQNWVAEVLRKPMVAKPGGPMIYSTGTTHVLGAALASATGETLLALVRRRLGEPLGFEVAPWTRDPQGFYLGGNEMALTPRAMLRLALLMRDEGRWGGAQIVPATWIRASMVTRTRSPHSGLSYGYGWFLTGSGYALARGYGGQIIAANPARGLAVAMTSDPTLPARSEGYFGDLMRLLEGPVLAVA